MCMLCAHCPSYYNHASFISHNPQSASIAAAALWGLSTTSVCRRQLSKLSVIPIVIRNIKRTLAMEVTPDPAVSATSVGGRAGAGGDAADLAAADDDQQQGAGNAPPPARSSAGAAAATEGDAAADRGQEEGCSGPPAATTMRKSDGAAASLPLLSEECRGYHSSDDDEDAVGGPPSEARRATFQRHLQGALSMLLVDRSCRLPYIGLEPSFVTLFKLCRNLEGYSSDKDVGQRRITAAKALTSLMQRDFDARISLVSSGSLKCALELLTPTVSRGVEALWPPQ